MNYEVKSKFIAPQLQGFRPVDYHFFGLWKQSLFSECFWVSSWNQELLARLGLEEKESGILILLDGNFFVKKSEIENIKKQIYQKIAEKNGDFFQEIVELDVSLATSDVLCTYWEGLIDYYAPMLRNY